MLRAAASILSLLAAAAAAARRADATYTTSPNHAIAKPGCDVNATVSLRYSSSSKRLYVESPDGVTRGGCVTLKKIWTELGGATPLFAVNASTGNVSDVATGTWLLTETLYVKHGITLQVRGKQKKMSVPKYKNRLDTMLNIQTGFIIRDRYSSRTAI